MTETELAPLSRDEFAARVGFPWRSLRKTVLANGLGMRLNGRWRFTDSDAVKARQIIDDKIAPPEAENYFIAHQRELDAAPEWHATIYLIRGERSRLIKIGYSQNVRQRLADLRNESPDDLEILALLVGRKALEQFLHSKFARYRRHGEWFENAQGIRRLAEDVRHHGQSYALDRIGWRAPE